MPVIKRHLDLGAITMNQLTKQKLVSPSGCTVIELEKIKIHDQFRHEQKKLEDMVAARFESGHLNMGADSCILRQSTLLDRLVVSEMEIEECERYYKKDQLSD